MTRVEEHALTIRKQIVRTWRLESIYEKDTRGEEIDAGYRAGVARSDEVIGVTAVSIFTNAGK
jgi:hypothetical protein